jgi:TonB family protein
MARFPGLMIFAAMLLMRAGTAQAADAACARPDVPLSPLMATHTLPPYPQMSVMTKEEGAVMLMVHIDAGGVPTAVEVDTSSGSVRLDEAARDHVKAVWRWSPMIKNCVPVPVATRVRIKWDLKDVQGLDSISPEMIASTMSLVIVDDADYPADQKNLTEQQMSMLMVTVDENGKVDAVSARPSGVPELDFKAIMLAKTKYRWTQATLNGKKIGASHLLIMFWVPPGVKKPDTKTFKDMITTYMKTAKGSQGAAAPAP